VAIKSYSAGTTKTLFEAVQLSM